MAEYAVNVADLTKHRFVAQWILAPVVPGRSVVDVEPGRFDGAGILLECDEERAQAIVDVIRTKLKKHQLRCYKKEGGSWKRV